MSKIFYLLLLPVCFTAANLSAQSDVWEVVEIVDEFGDKTGDKRLAYQTSGTFTNSATRNSDLDVMLLVDNPRGVNIIVFEYGRYRVELNGGLFTYKIGDTRIEHVPIKGKHDSVRLQGRIDPRDEKTSLFYLLKQGGLIKFSVYEEGSTYRFDVNADGFLKLLSEVFTNTDSYLSFYYEVPGINNKLIEVEFTLNFKWDLEKEKQLKNNPDLQILVADFFRDKDKDFVLDRPGGYYQKEKAEQNWGVPLLDNIRHLFSDQDLEYISFRAW
jgi:hypothetical protein